MTAPITTRWIVPPDVLCELAHELTVRECAYRGFVLDDDGDDETLYTAEAQSVFDCIYDIAARVLERRNAEVQP